MPIGRILGGIARAGLGLLKAPVKIATAAAPLFPGLAPFAAKGNLALNLLGTTDQLFNTGNAKMNPGNEFARLLQLQLEFNRILSTNPNDVR